MEIKEGSRYKLVDGLGVGPGSIIKGQTVVVREVVPAEVPGAHDDKEDAVVVEWEEPAQVIGDDGNVTIGSVKRAVSVAVDQFDSMFEAADGKSDEGGQA